jgi:putative proteasome-type protease
MTYCVAMSLDAGMIFASDSRTNAGVDQIARFSKMKVFVREGDRVIVTLSSGNLSSTQNALNVVEQGARGETTRTCGMRSRCSTWRGSSVTRCAT